jgi:uncharacterized protein (UPF0248 family)
LKKSLFHEPALGPSSTRFLDGKGSEIMMPIHELLNKIRWDKDFGLGSFEIGYLDRLEQKVIRIPMGELHFEPGNSFSFDWHTPKGEVITVPLHRIREVFRNGVPIWSRKRGARP